MFEITVLRLSDRKTVRVQASHQQMLVDHLAASAARHGFQVRNDHEMSWMIGYAVGDLLKGGNVVATWEIGEIK